MTGSKRKGSRVQPDVLGDVLPPPLLSVLPETDPDSAPAVVWAAPAAEARESDSPAEELAGEPVAPTVDDDPFPINMEAGHLDLVQGNVAEGWAVNLSEMDLPAQVDVLVDGVIIGSTAADLFRDDLQKAGIRDGYAAFSFTIPLSYYDGRQHTVAVVLRETNQQIVNSPLTFRGSPGEMPVVAERRAWAERKVLTRKSSRADALPASVAQRKRLAILSTFHAGPNFFSYHHALADALTSAGFIVLIVHASDTVGQGLEEIDRDDTYLYVKRNIGYDFGSWAVGVYAVADLLGDLDELVLFNDSIIGPAFDISRILDSVRKRGADAVGLTDSYERTYHLQSYFLWFGPRICRSSILQLFMAQYSFSSDKETVIREGELGLTKFLLEQGFETAALYGYERVAGVWLDKVPHVVRAIENLPNFEPGGSNSERPRSYRDTLLERMETIVSAVVCGEPVNPAHFFWDVLLEEFGHPFLKREFLFVNPSTIPTYFRIPELLARLPASMQTHVMDARRRYGGRLVPFLR